MTKRTLQEIADFFGCWVAVEPPELAALREQVRVLRDALEWIDNGMSTTPSFTTNFPFSNTI